MTTELSELSNNNLEILDKNLDLLREPDEELSDSGESWYSENSEQGDIFIRTININLPSEREQSYDHVKKLEDYKLAEIYKINFENLNGKHLIEITKMQIPVAKISKNYENEIKYDTEFNSKKY